MSKDYTRNPPYSDTPTNQYMINDFSNINKDGTPNYISRLVIWYIFDEVKEAFPSEIDDSDYVFTTADAYIKLNLNIDIETISTITSFELISYYSFTFYNKSSPSIIKHKDLYSSWTISVEKLDLYFLGVNNDILKMQFKSYPVEYNAVSYVQSGVTLEGVHINNIGSVPLYEILFDNISGVYPNITFVDY